MFTTAAIAMPRCSSASVAVDGVVMAESSSGLCLLTVHVPTSVNCSCLYRQYHTLYSIVKSLTGGILKKCVDSQAMYPQSEQHALKARERRYTAHEEGKHWE